VLASLDIAVRPILGLRNPIEVAASLEARDGFVPDYSHFMWLRHMLDAEAASRGRARALISFDALLQDWTGTMEGIATALGLDWPQAPDAVARAEAPNAHKTLRHHWNAASEVTDNAALPAWLRDTYRIMHRWTQTGIEHATPEDFAALDRISAEMAAAGPTFGPLIAQGHKVSRRLVTQKRRMVAQEAELTALQAALSETASALDRMAVDRDETADRLDQAERALAANRAALVAARTAQRQATEAGWAAEQRQKDLILILQALQGARYTGWLHQLSSRIRLRRQMEAVAETGLFDSAWYLSVNDDVARAGVDPLRHYVVNGITENRHPRPLPPPSEERPLPAGVTPIKPPLVDAVSPRTAEPPPVQPFLDRQRRQAQ
jgi:hypothetical protein